MKYAFTLILLSQLIILAIAGGGGNRNPTRKQAKKLAHSAVDMAFETIATPIEYAMDLANNAPKARGAKGARNGAQTSLNMIGDAIGMAQKGTRAASDFIDDSDGGNIQRQIKGRNPVKAPVRVGVSRRGAPIMVNYGHDDDESESSDESEISEISDESEVSDGSDESDVFDDDRNVHVGFNARGGQRNRKQNANDRNKGKKQQGKGRNAGRQQQGQGRNSGRQQQGQDRNSGRQEQQGNRRSMGRQQQGNGRSMARQQQGKGRGKSQKQHNDWDSDDFDSEPVKRGKGRQSGKRNKQQRYNDDFESDDHFDDSESEDFFPLRSQRGKGRNNSVQQNIDDNTDREFEIRYNRRARGGNKKQDNNRGGNGSKDKKSGKKGRGKR